jgi:8-oxo-dGTP pyrophosphatase MutT (NUDIX family)
MSVAVPEMAATVALLRERGKAVEALLLRRHANLNFLGGAWVFPGGKLDAADGSPAAARFTQTVASPMRRPFFAAVGRELFEEAGLLLAIDAAGQPVRRDAAERLRASCRATGAAASAFFTALDARSLRLDTENIIEWANWITPAGVPRRFDTHFFIAAAPVDQVPEVDLAESTEVHWQDIAEIQPGWSGLKAMAPTLFTMLELADGLRRYGSIGALLRGERARPIARILPKSVQTPGGAQAVYPWDPDYASLPGEGLELAPDMLARYAGRPRRWDWMR